MLQMQRIEPPEWTPEYAHAGRCPLKRGVSCYTAAEVSHCARERVLLPGEGRLMLEQCMKHIVRFLGLICCAVSICACRDTTTATGHARPSATTIPATTVSTDVSVAGDERGMPTSGAYIPIRSLADVSIYVGERAFNEIYNQGYTTAHDVGWHAPDLVMRTDGQVHGTVTTTTSAPPPSLPFKQDLLFVQVRSSYVFPVQGDYAHHPASDIIAISATHTSPLSATFQVQTTFVPPALTLPESDLRLAYAELNFTWVRVYQTPEGYAFQVFPGRESFPEAPQIGFNQPPQPVQGRFGYYDVIADRETGRNMFDYVSWINNNLP